MPRADEIVVVPLYLPCARRLELAHVGCMPRAQEDEPRVGLVMPHADDAPAGLPATGADPAKAGLRVKSVAADFRR
jgi:hypothetical protein